MIFDFGLWLKTLLMRCLGYVLGICVVLAILGVGAFVFFKPFLVSFVDNEIKKYGVVAESSTISMLGKINLKNVTIPMQDGSSLTAEIISARPPVPFLGGTASLYNVLLQKGDMSVYIPVLHLDGISQGAKDPAISSRKMQRLMQVQVSSIEAPEIALTIGQGNKTGKVIMQHLYVGGVRNGKISSVAVNGIDSRFAPASSLMDQPQPNIHGGRFYARDIDIAAAYAFLMGQTGPGDTVRPVLGPVLLNDLKINFANKKGENFRLLVGALNSNGLALNPAETPPFETIKAFFAAGRVSDVSAEDKKKALQDLLYLLSSIAAIDAEMRNVAIDTPQLKTDFAFFTLKPGNWNQIIPQAFVLSLQDFNLDMTQMSSAYAQFLREMGYVKLSLSLEADMLWNSADHTMLLRNISFAGKDIGEVLLKGKLINFDEGFFGGDKSQMMSALINAAISELDMTVADRGIINHFIEWETTQINVSRQELQDSLYEIAVKSPPLLLKNHQNTPAISQALGAFVRDSGTLRVQMTAREKRGINLFDIAAAQNDTDILFNQIDFHVSVDGQPVQATDMQ